MRRYLLALPVLILLAGCASLQIRSDYDPQYDFSKLHRYTVLEQPSDAADSLTLTHIDRAVDAVMAAKGYRKTPKGEADFYLLYHIDVRNVSEVQTDYEYAGLRPYPYNYYRSDLSLPYPPPPYIDPYSLDRRVVKTTRTYEYKQGKLIIDAYDPKTNKVVWRGIAEDEITGFDSAQEKIDYINRAIRELFDSFPGSSKTR